MRLYQRCIIRHGIAIAEALSDRRPFSIIETRTTRFMEAS
jgi:hypothetical protein